ncbi:MAG: alpha-galactosidase [Victivallaceae bacterium]|nr:alpha-galactosidase [Victivallaceae bacterium]
MKVADFTQDWGFGKLQFEFGYCDSKGKLILPQKSKATALADGLKLDLEYASGVREVLFFERSGKEGFLCRRSFINGAKKIEVSELKVAVTGIDFKGVQKDDYFYHVENPRVYEVLAMPIDYDRVKNAGSLRDTGFDFQAGNRWADPGVVHERIGRSPYQPFPAILVSNMKSDRGIVHGTLSQKIFYHNYLLRHDKAGKIVWEIFSGCKAISARIVSPGETLTDAWYFGATCDAADFDHLFDNYTNCLRQELPPMYGATAVNRDNVVWGTWNDGIFRDVSEKMIVDEAKYLAANFPTCRWIQLDDGYAVYTESAHGLGMPYEGKKGFDYKKFPGGFRGLTDKIRETGLRPALWIGGFVPTDCKLFKDHPEWFIDYSYRVTQMEPLDISLPEVRDYATRALDEMVTKGGFDAVKHDFWSYAYEDSNPLLKNREKTGYEWREWWTTEFRKRLAPDGYFQTGCDICMGNVFLGTKFSNYRYGIDIGGGNWTNVKINFLWGIACFATHTGDLFVPNSDSIGLFPGLNDVDAQFCVNYCLVTHSMVEIAGLLSKNTKHKRFKMLAKAVCNPNNGQDVYLANYDYRDHQHQIPRILYFKTPHFSTAENAAHLPLRTIGFFNTDDEKITVDFAPADIGLSNRKLYQLTDVWSGKSFFWQGKSSIELLPHGSRLFAVSLAGDKEILDANMRIVVNGKELAFDYAGKAELVTSSRVAEVRIDGEKVKSVCRDNGDNYLVKFEVPKAGKLELIWK